MKFYDASHKSIPAPLPVARVLVIAVALLIAVSSGCSRLRLPAIDPTGKCLFAPCPTTTTLALPGSAGEGCFGHSGGRAKFLKIPKSNSGLAAPTFSFPEPAFPEPETPPACAAPESSDAAGASDEPCVAGPQCDGACQTGPPAVLFGNEIGETRRHCLPPRGKRGCILLSPQKIVAPVGGEVVLLSGICGTDGYLQMGEPLEWMLTPDSVGTFIQIGDDDPGILHKLVVRKRTEKHDPAFARGVTSTKKALITRGNLDPRDDVSLEKGQTWITISSPSEGVSRVTVLAPESECWDNRKATATIYWIDARWQFPGPQSVASGTPVQLNTRVTRAEGTLPARGWKVRYEILQPELATFAGTNGSAVIEATVDDSGNATVDLVPNQGTSGIATIDMQVIRPGGESDNMPSMTLGRGQTFVTWSAPQLAVRAGAPAVATYDAPVQVVANVSNPGDQAAENVRVAVQLPPGIKVVSADSFAQVLPSAVVWEIGTIPTQTQLDLFMTIAAQSPVQLTFQARGDPGLLAEDTVRIDVFQPSLSVDVRPEKDRYEAGEEVKFAIDVRNTGNRPLQNVGLKATGDEAMIQQQTGTRLAANDKKDGPLQPGQTWSTTVTYIPTQSGRRCIDVESTADGGQRASGQACVTVINPIPPTPALSVTLEGRESIATGAAALFRARIANTGEVPLRNVRVSMVYDPQLELLQATEGADPARLGQYLIAWIIPTLAPGEPAVLEGQFRAIATNPRSRIILTAQSDEGARANSDFVFEIVPGLAPARPEAAPSPLLPPVLPPPTIPGGPGSPPDTSPQGPIAPSLPPPPVRTDRIIVQLFETADPVRVGEPIRYTLRVTNDSNQQDDQVSIRFALPDGVALDRVTQRRSPELGQYQNNAGMIYLPDIRTMRAGESIDYDLVLRSNQPQTFDLVVEAESRRLPPGGVSSSVQTTVIP